MGELSELRGLGPASEAQLNDIGLYTREDLVAIGPVAAFKKLQDEADSAPSLNFLYALVGAVENKDWRDIARRDRTRLIMELDGLDQFDRLTSRDDKGRR